MQGGIKELLNRSFAIASHFAGLKTMLMLTNSFAGRLLLLGFMVLVGFTIARSLYVGSVWGAVLAFISLAAGVCFIYLLLNMHSLSRENREEETY